MKFGEARGGGGQPTHVSHCWHAGLWDFGAQHLSLVIVSVSTLVRSHNATISTAPQRRSFHPSAYDNQSRITVRPAPSPPPPSGRTKNRRYGDHWVSPGDNDLKRAALKAQYDVLAATDRNIHLFLNAGDELFAGNALENPTVAGTHPSDLGHREVATFWTQYLPALLADAE